MIRVIIWKSIDVISILIIFLALIVVIGWTTNTEFFQFFSKESTYTALLCASLVLFISMWQALININIYVGAGALRKTLSEAIHLLCANGRIKNFSILAVTTGKILPLVSSSSVIIDNCILILPLFKGAKEGSKEDRNNVRCAEYISQWKQLQTSGRIKNLEILRISHWPDLYVCIADRRALTAGFFTYKANGEVEPGIAAEFTDTIYVKPINENSRQLFYFYSEWFEKVRTTCRKYETEDK